jgi:hypothetical protein
MTTSNEDWPGIPLWNRLHDVRVRIEPAATEYPEMMSDQSLLGYMIVAEDTELTDEERERGVVAFRLTTIAELEAFIEDISWWRDGLIEARQMAIAKELGASDN